MNSKAKLAVEWRIAVLLLTSLRAQTVALPYELVVKPIFVEDPVSGHISVLSDYASSFAVFQEATQRVYAQAGIRVVWETSSVYVASSSNLYDLGSGETASINMGDLTQTAGHGQSTTPKTLNLWFTAPTSTGTLGISEQSTNVGTGAYTRDPIIRNGSTVSETIFIPGAYYSLTTLPHELGHSLGLNHNVIDAGPTYSSTLLTGGNLMNGGIVGAQTMSDITTDGVTGFGL